MTQKHKIIPQNPDIKIQLHSDMNSKNKFNIRQISTKIRIYYIVQFIGCYNKY